jgi:hypothetical protein
LWVIARHRALIFPRGAIECASTREYGRFSFEAGVVESGSGSFEQSPTLYCLAAISID